MIISFLTKRWPRARGSCRSPGHGLLVAVSAAVCAAGLALTLGAGAADARTAPAPPQPGVTLGAAAAPGSPTFLFYTGTDRQVWTVDLSLMAQHVPYPLGGQLIGGPAVVWIPRGPLSPTGGMAVFGRGTDNRLWWTYQTASGWSRWASLGGNLTSKPGVAADQYSLLIYARGADGAVWGRQEYNRAGLWIGWHKIGGRVLPGTAPAAGYGLGVFIAVVGTDHTVWLGEDLYGSPGLRWRSIGGRSNSDPGLDVPGEGSPAEGRVVVFARGTDNAAWYNEARSHTAGVTAGWHSLGGALTSGMTAFTSLVPGYTSVYALGSDRRPWVDSGTWPELTRWQPVRLTSGIQREW